MNPTIKKHCENLYAKLQEEAKLEENRLIWRGSFSRAVSEVGIPTGYYSTVKRHLTYHGCITQLHRGSASVPTEIELHRSPESIPEWQSAPSDDLTTTSEYAKLEQKIDDLAKLVGGTHIGEALREITQKQTQLERDILLLQKERTQNDSS